MKNPRRRMRTPQTSVKCTGCGVTAIRYDYGFRGRMRWAKSARRPRPLQSCYLCGSPVEPHQFPTGR